MVLKTFFALLIAIGLLGAVEVTPQMMDDPIPHCFPCD